MRLGNSMVHVITICNPPPLPRKKEGECQGLREENDPREEGVQERKERDRREERERKKTGKRTEEQRE